MSNTRLWHARQGPIRAVSTFPFRKTCSILFLCFIHFENHVTFKHQFPWNQFYSIQFPKLWVANNIIRHDKKISLSWGIKSFALVLLPLITNLFLCVGFFPQSKSNWIPNKRVNCVCALWCTRDLSKLYLQPLPYCMWAGSGHKWTLVTPVGIMDGWMMIKACSRVPYIPSYTIGKTSIQNFLSMVFHSWGGLGGGGFETAFRPIMGNLKLLSSHTQNNEAVLGESAVSRRRAR